MPTASKTIRAHPDGRRRRRRANPLIYAGAAFLCALFVAFVGFHGRAAQAPAPAGVSPQSMTVVVTIDGQGVPVRELELFLAQERAATFAYFQQYYGDGDSPGFWTRPYAGQTPQDYLKKLAVTDAVRATVQLDLARRYGLIPDTGYATFLKALSAENTRRRQALAQHQPIYGPQQYTETTFFTYEMSQIGTSLQSVLVERGVISVTNAALRQYYNAHLSEYQQIIGASGTVSGPQAPAASTSASASFDQAKGQVEQEFEASRYGAVIAQYVDAATVHVDADVLAAIHVD